MAPTLIKPGKGTTMYRKHRPQERAEPKSSRKENHTQTITNDLTGYYTSLRQAIATAAITTMMQHAT